MECPTGSGRMCTLFELAREISRRLSAIFLRNDAGERPVYGDVEKFQSDPHFRDLISFYATGRHPRDIPRACAKPVPGHECHRRFGPSVERSSAPIWEQLRRRRSRSR